MARQSREVRTFVRLESIREIQPWFNGGLVLLLRTGAKQVSRGNRERVLAAAGGR